MRIKNKINLKYGDSNLRKNIFSLNLMLPALVIIALVMVYPTVYAFIMSFFRWTFDKPLKFIGFDNYIKIFTNSLYFHSLWITILFTIVVTILTIVISLYIALLLNMELKGTNLCMAFLLIPWAIPPIVNGIIWGYIFHPRLGTFNNLLIEMGILKKFVAWQSLPWPAFILIVITTVYKSLPLVVLLLSASLKTIPKEIYEASDVDGMSHIGKFFKITLPLIRPSMAIIFILLSISTFKAFDMIYILTKGGPSNFTAMLNYLAYTVTFKQMTFGLGASIAFLSSFLILILSIIYYKTSYREVRYD